MSGISDEAIRERAYHIWVREGCPHGRDFDHWVQAQVELTAEEIAAAANGGNGAVKRSPAKRPRAAAAPKAVVAAKPARNAAPRAARVKKR